MTNAMKSTMTPEIAQALKNGEYANRTSLYLRYDRPAGGADGNGCSHLITVERIPRRCLDTTAAIRGGDESAWTVVYTAIID